MPLDNDSKKVLLIAIAVILMVLSATGTNIFSLKVLGQTPMNDTVTLIAGSNTTLVQDTLNSTITINSLGGAGSDNSKINKSGDIMTGQLGIGTSPISPLDIGTTSTSDRFINIQTTNTKATGAGIYGIVNDITYAGAFSISAITGTYSRVNYNSAGNTVTNAYGFRILNPVVTGTITNNYGLKVDDMTSGTTQNYAISTGLGKVNIGSLNSTGTHAVCTYSSTVIVSSTNATSNYLTC